MVEALGLSLKEFIFYLINFLILVAVLGKFLYKPFLSALEKRKKAIQEAFDNADAKNAEAEQKMEEYKSIISDVEAEKRAIIKEAKEKAEAQAAGIIREAHEEAARTIKAAERDIERDRVRAAAEMREEIAELAMLAAEKIMRKEIDISGHEGIIDEVIKEGAAKWQN